ncbi:MAG: alpha/beta hydrolase [Parvularculaceae bacterium]|nr:alpha/beta hydrolase [Parvularculaceae bacterium]
MGRWQQVWGVALLALATACGSPTEQSTPFTEAACQVGVYTDGKNQQLVLTGEEGRTRYARSDGTVSRVSSDNAAILCGEGAVKLADGQILTQVAIKSTLTTFTSGQVTLAGQLLEHPDADANTALVVLAHGSEELGWINDHPDPYHMVARGVSAFVYDKRGTGQSEGQYSQNFPQLADDLVAASAEAKRLAAGRYERFGLIGLSQGGWIAPLAAKRANADFIGIGYGLVVDITEEDAAQVQKELRDAGYGPDVLAIAKTITDTTSLIAKSSYQEGLEELDALRATYGEEPWFGRIKGGFTGVILSIPSEVLRTEGIPMFDRLNIDWSLDPVEVLSRVNVPQLWALAEEDGEAPIDQTLARLITLREGGQIIDIRVFRGADHGMWLLQPSTNDKNISGQIAPGFHDLMADWANGALQPVYGDSFSR